MQVYARISITLASDADYAVILRRGPSNQVATLGWDLKKNTLSIGQWLKGTIPTFDISPDGKYLIYFARSAKFGNTWIAVSQAPFLKALDFYPANSAWEYECFFLDNKSYWINQSVLDNIKRHQSSYFKHSHFRVITDQERSQPPSSWRPFLIEEITLSNQRKYSIAHAYKLVLTNNWALIINKHNQYSLQHNKSNETIELPTWYSATRYKNRVLFSEYGQLKSLDISKLDHENPLSHAVTLHDLNDMQFEEIVAPY